MPQMTVCPSCAEHLEPEDRFCGNCGTALVASPERERPVAGQEIPRQQQAPAATTSDDARSDDGAADDRASDDGASDGGISDSGPASDTEVCDEDDAHSGDYGLAPPAQNVDARGPRPPAEPPVPPVAAAAQPRPPASAVSQPRPGVADPRQELLMTETGTPDACVACGADGSGDGPGVGEDGVCRRCGHVQPKERDHVERELPEVAAVTDRGLRHHRNEDAFAVSRADLPDGGPAVIAVVCDGVSSATRPDEASAAACEAADASLRITLAAGGDPGTAMRDALLSAAEAVNALADPETRDDPHRNAPACTCVSAVVTGDLLTVGWIGDSRAYWIPDDRSGERPARLTEDDSWAARMVEAGLMSQDEAYADPRAHAITGWLGADAVELDPHTASFQPDLPGVVVVCSDGLWNYAESAAELAAVVPADARAHPLRAAQSLIGVALDGGGHDNITVAVVPFPVRA
ncbi:protein phosphatase 2C domain-containing protein [Streptomyces sp. PTM05]|uniref:Protein phosphatase 2C domain-containing protein n=1 Tax=Streptantibioticus parmotrematis TaxID=2873249 RepID=A0ABS7QTJ0_9ACTN|nr:protein phosphatase 2C domain-containing protein [Streptantibioticus parmotrematis]MBY8886513.1 protein phosphatase 2C domain-containing protein [Streptantibioticus parmotrematis]